VVKTRPSRDGTVGDIFRDSDLPFVEGLPASLADRSRIFGCHVELNLSEMDHCLGCE
jgi:hypothetical protein